MCVIFNGNVGQIRVWKFSNNDKHFHTYTIWQQTEHCPLLHSLLLIYHVCYDVNCIYVSYRFVYLSTYVWVVFTYSSFILYGWVGTTLIVVIVDVVLVVVAVVPIDFYYSYNVIFYASLLFLLIMCVNTLVQS